MINEYAIVNQYSLCSFYCESFFEKTMISSGTCFLTKRYSRLYLVTNWHVVSGRNPDTGECLSEKCAIPDSLHVFFPIRSGDGVAVEFNNEYQIVPIRDCHNGILWNEKQIGSRYIDVAIIPVVVEDKFIANCIEEAEEPYNDSTSIEITSSLYVLGFPFGRKYGCKLPIWKRATVASEPKYELDEGFPYFFVDTASRKGMSGSPVVYFERRPITIVGNDSIASTHFTKHIGLYSGRIGVDDLDNVQLGRVWKASVIDDLIGIGTAAE